MLDIPERIFKALQDETPQDERNSCQMYPTAASIRLKDGTILGSCAREQYYRWFKCKRDSSIEPESSMIFKVGDSLHELAVSLIRSLSRTSNLRVLSQEQRIWNPSYLISGRSDCVLLDEITNEIYGCEIKTVGDGAIYVMDNKPKIEHIMQSFIYLDSYTKNAKLNGTKPPKAWILLYMARSENWKLQKYPHGSSLKYMWQYTITLDDQGNCHVKDQNQNSIDVNGLNIDMIYDRYDEVLTSIRNKKLPDRDFTYQYDETTLTALSKAGKLNKAQTGTVDKWLADGAPTGELDVDKGDYQCRYCSYRNTCYSTTPDVFDLDNDILIPIKKSQDTSTNDKKKTKISYPF